MQLHYQAFILFFFVGLMALYDLIVLKRAWRPWLKAVGAGALTFLPLLFDLGLTAVNLNRIVAYFTSVHSQIYQTTFTWPFIWDFISRFYGLILGYSHPTYFWARLVFIGGSIIIGLIGIKETFKSKTLSPYLLLMIFLACSLVGLRVYKGDKWEYFLSFMYYVPVMTIALSAALVFSKRAIIIFAISAFSAGLVFPPLSRPKSDDVAKLLYLNQQIESRYGDRIDLYNLYPYIDHAISYLWPQRAISGSAETIVAICPAKYRCHRPSSSIPTIAGSPIEQLLLDRSIQVSDTFVVDDLQAVAYQSL